MFSIYDKNRITFNDGTKVIDFVYGAEIVDFEDSFVLETQIAIDDIVRGWLGDVRIVLTGRSIIDYCTTEDNVQDVVLYKDALCYRRTVEQSYPEAATYKYMFMKY